MRFPLRLRVPSWATRGGSIKLNGRPLEGFAAPGDYFVLDRTEDWLKPIPGTLEFRTVGQAQEVTLMPLSTVFDERYAVYWRVQP